MSDEGSPRRVGLHVGLGVGLAFLFALGFLTLLEVMMGVANDSIRGSMPNSEESGAALEQLSYLYTAEHFIGISQLLYIVPAVLMARRRSRAGIATGLIWGAALIFLLDAAFWFSVYLLKGFHL